MAKPFDRDALNNAIIETVTDTFEKLCHVQSGAEAQVVEKDLIEFDGRMRVSPMEKFNGPAYVAVFNYYLSQKALDQGMPVGTFIFIIKEDFTEKLLRPFNRSMKDAESEESMMEVCGQMGGVLAGNLKNALVAQGYSDLLVSEPTRYKSIIPNGVPFDYGLYQKQEFIFTFWGQKCIAIEACLSAVPKAVK